MKRKPDTLPDTLREFVAEVADTPLKTDGADTSAEQQDRLNELTEHDLWRAFRRLHDIVTRARSLIGKPKPEPPHMRV